MELNFSYDSALGSLVLGTIERFKHRTFLKDASTEREFTYGEFHRAACSLAMMLRRQGVQRGSRVAILLENSPEYVILYFACLYIGAIAVPVNLQLHRRERDFILSKSNPHVLVVSPVTRDLIASDPAEAQTTLILSILTDASVEVSGIGDTLWHVDAASAEGGSQWQPLSGVVATDLLSITFTSGTTSMPKGVCHRIESLFESAYAFNKTVQMKETTRLLHVTSMAYMAGFLNTLICPFLAGASVVVSRPFDARMAIEFWDTPVKYEVNALWLVPSMLSALLRLDRGQRGKDFCRSHVKLVCVGTAALPGKLKQQFEEAYGVTLFESYGLSETLFVAANSPCIEYKMGSVGVPFEGIHLRILGEDGSELMQGYDGEILVQSPFLMAGYLNYETDQVEQNTGEWFSTGDLGHVVDSGHLYITGRKKDLVIRGGINISPRAVEDVLIEHEAVADVSVIGLPHELYGEEVVAVVKLKAGYSLEKERPSLEGLCKKHLSLASIPTKYVAITEFPTGATGKVQKGKLVELLRAEAGAAGT